MHAGQSLLREREDDVLTASHGREVGTLLTQATHYSGTVRAEAVRGLCDIATKRGGLQVGFPSPT